MRWLTDHRSPVSGALVLAGLAAFPLLVTTQFWMNIAVMACIYAIACLGLTLLYGLGRQLSFGQAGFYGIGAYVSAILAVEAGVNVWLGILAGAVAAAAIAYAIGRPILRLNLLSLVMVTIAFNEIVLVLFEELAITGGPNGVAGVPPPSVGDFSFEALRDYYWFVLGVAVVVYLFTRNVARGAYGRRLQAAGIGPRAAQSVGVDIARTRGLAFTFAAFLAGLAGALFAHYSLFIGPEGFSIQFSLLLVLAVCIGGSHSVVGAVLGAAFMASVPLYLGGSGASATLLYGLLLTLVFMVAPRGLVGVWEAARDRTRRPLEPEVNG